MYSNNNHIQMVNISISVSIKDVSSMTDLKNFLELGYSTCKHFLYDSVIFLSILQFYHLISLEP
jgi:hypothetical protein